MAIRSTQSITLHTLIWYEVSSLSPDAHLPLAHLYDVRKVIDALPELGLHLTVGQREIRLQSH